MNREPALDECPHGGDPFTCPPCQTPPRARPPVLTSPTTIAQHGSRCIGCDDRIKEGDRIALVDEAWVCEWCAEEENRG